MIKNSFLNWILAFALSFSFCTTAEAQLGKNLMNRAKRSVDSRLQRETEKAVQKGIDKSVDAAKKEVTTAVSNASVNKNESKVNSVKPTKNEADAQAIYVSASNGSNRNDGSMAAPLKDLQKAVNAAPEGAIICVAEGNYLGSMDQGYIEVKKYISIVGGYSSDFSDWDPTKYITSIRPGVDQAGTSGSHGLLDIYVRGKRNGVVLIDGLSFDKGQMNAYCEAIHDNPVAAAPEGCETGRMVLVGESPVGTKVGGAPLAQQLIHGDVEGEVIIRNCTFVNAYHFAIEMGCVAGHFDIYNNVFVANRMAACEVRGMNANPSLCSIDFHHNTVLFSWCRTKVMDTMGLGFRYMTGINANVYNNIFGCSNLAALERTFIDSDAKKEAARITSATNNRFFMNNADLLLPSGGGKWTKVSASQFEDAEQLNEYQGNEELAANEAFINAIDPAYLKGFAGISIQHSQSYDRNSAANQVNRIFGLNQQGTETIRVTMFANRYPFEKAFDLFGVVPGFGAQSPTR